MPSSRMSFLQARRGARMPHPLILILALLALTSLLHLVQASQVNITVSKIRELEAEKARIQRENAELSHQIAEREALPHIMKRARDMGLAPLLEIAYLPAPEDLMPSRELAASPVEQDKLRASLGRVTMASSRWWREVVSQFNAWVRMRPRPVEAKAAP